MVQGGIICNPVNLNPLAAKGIGLDLYYDAELNVILPD